MFLKHPDEKDLKQISLDEFEESLMKYVQPDRLNPEDTYIPLNDYEGNEKACKKCWLSVCDSQNCDNK